MNLFEYKRNKNFLYHPDSPFIFSENKILNYKEFEREVKRTAKYFHDVGIGENDYVIILSVNSLEFVVNVFSLWTLGAVPVPLNIRLGETELIKLIEFCKCKFVIAANEYEQKIEAGTFKILHSHSNFPKNSEAELPENQSDLYSTAVIIFTSGSTGNPKGVILTFKNLIRSNEIGNQILEQNENDRWLASLPFYHIGGFSIIARAFLSNASIIIPNSLRTEDLIFSIRNQKPTLVSFVSTQLQRLINENCKPNPELKNVLLGGGFSDEELCRQALKNNWNITKVYGSSEVSSFVSAVNLKKGTNKITSSGLALPPNEIKIIDDSSNPLPSKTPGEIIVKSDSVMKGYLNNETETNKKLKNGFYLTGDIGYLDEEGYLYVEARRTDLIVSGGENINPLEIEKIIMTFEHVKEVCVFPLTDNEWGQIAVAAIVGEENHNLSFNELKNYLKTKIAGYKIPKKFFLIDKLPKTDLGKVLREELIKKFSLGINIDN